MISLIIYWVILSGTKLILYHIKLKEINKKINNKNKIYFIYFIYYFYFINYFLFSFSFFFSTSWINKIKKKQEKKPYKRLANGIEKENILQLEPLPIIVFLSLLSIKLFWLLTRKDFWKKTSKIY